MVENRSMDITTTTRAGREKKSITNFQLLPQSPEGKKGLELANLAKLGQVLHALLQKREKARRRKSE